ncbi:LysR family transcriptional regulator substrate-binding protein [Streptomyces longispororuber]|uniref:LysR family transcriptional regulator substrate-binding protein n=1 Tax=Streptomyces longispororuber TaxID=68230 RepID=UPI0033C45CAC
MIRRKRPRPPPGEQPHPHDHRPPRHLGGHGRYDPRGHKRPGSHGRYDSCGHRRPVPLDRCDSCGHRRPARSTDATPATTGGPAHTAVTTPAAATAPSPAPRPLPLAALAGRPLISLPRGTGLRATLERACARAGFTPRVAFEAAAPEVLAELAARGLGVAVFPASEAEVEALGLRALPFAEPCPRGRIALARRAGGPEAPAARAFLARLRAALGNGSGTGAVRNPGPATGPANGDGRAPVP